MWTGTVVIALVRCVHGRVLPTVQSVGCNLGRGILHDRQLFIAMDRHRFFARAHWIDRKLRPTNGPIRPGLDEMIEELAASPTKQMPQA